MQIAAKSELLDLLTYVNMDLSDNTLNGVINMAKNQILEEHKFKIFFSATENVWRSYLPDETRSRKRRSIKRREKADLENLIVKFYIDESKKAQSVRTLEAVYESWLIYRRDFTPAKHKTIYENVMDWNKFISGTELAKTSINTITPVMLTRFFRAVTKDRNISHKRISNVRSVLNGIMIMLLRKKSLSIIRFRT